MMLEVLKDTTELMPAYFDIGSSYTDSQETEKAENYYNAETHVIDSENIELVYTGIK